MTETEALQRYDAFLWEQVHAFCRCCRRKQQPLEDFIQVARIAFLQHIRTHAESEWAACTMTIRRALYDFARAEYPLTCSHHGFAKILREGIRFYPHDEYFTSLGEWYEDDHSGIDLMTFVDGLKAEDREIIAMRLEGLTVVEISKRMNKPHQVISYRLKTIRQKMVA